MLKRRSLERYSFQTVMINLIFRELFLTYIHLAAFELLNTKQLVTASSVNSGQIVTFSLALAKSFVVERSPDILVVAVFIPIWKSVRLTAFTHLDVMQPRRAISSVEASDKVTGWANRPGVGSYRRKKIWK